VLDASIGGHARSSATIAKALVENGNSVVFIGPENSPVLQKGAGGVQFVALPAANRNPLRDAWLLRELSKIIRTRNIEVIHTFDLHSHVAGYFLSRCCGIPVVSTICGGTIKYRYPYTRPVIVFSRELKETMTRVLGFREDEVIVEPARMYLRGFRSSIQELPLPSYPGVCTSVKKLVMIARLSQTKVNSILHSLYAVESLARQRDDFMLVVIGASQDETVKSRIVSRINQINDSVGRTVVVHDESLSSHAAHYLASADVVIGVGRVCFEGMIFGKPVMVVGESGFAGCISPSLSDDDLSAIAHYNFSGRNVLKHGLPGGGDGRQAMAQTLERLLTDAMFRNDTAEFGYRYVLEHYDVHAAVRTYERVYSEVTGMVQQPRDSLVRAMCGYGILLGGKIKDVYHRLKKSDVQYSRTD